MRLRLGTTKTRGCTRPTRVLLLLLNMRAAGLVQCCFLFASTGALPAYAHAYLPAAVIVIVTVRRKSDDFQGAGRKGHTECVGVSYLGQKPGSKAHNHHRYSHLFWNDCQKTKTL